MHKHCGFQEILSWYNIGVMCKIFCINFFFIGNHLHRAWRNVTGVKYDQCFQSKKNEICQGKRPSLSYTTLVWGTLEREVSVNAGTEGKKWRRQIVNKSRETWYYPHLCYHSCAQQQWTFAPTNHKMWKCLPGVLERPRWQLFSQSLVIFITDICWA